MAAGRAAEAGPHAGAIPGDLEGRSAPTVLIGLGAQKAATRWLHRQLSRHPAVHFHPMPEGNYWNTMRSPRERVWRQAAETRLRKLDGPFGWKRQARRLVKGGHRKREDTAAYLRLLGGDGLDHRPYLDFLGAHRSDVAVVGDITPAYALSSPSVFAEMYALTDDVRFIFTMRDPVERLVSGVNFMARHHSLEPETRAKVARQRFLEALEMPHERDILMSRYDETIANLEAAVPRDRILYLFYERLGEDGFADAVLGFLGLAPDRPWAADEPVNRNLQQKWAPTELERARAREVLRETYEWLHDRFADAVPPQWHRPDTTRRKRM